MGYSLPESDLTVRLMLINHVNSDTQIYIIDNNIREHNGKFELQIKYNKLLKNNINCNYIKNNAIPDFMKDYGDYNI